LLTPALLIGSPWIAFCIVFCSCFTRLCSSNGSHRSGHRPKKLPSHPLFAGANPDKIQPLCVRESLQSRITKKTTKTSN
jgi:hypothetical protein